MNFLNYTIDTIYECSNAQNGYPTNLSIYEYLDVKPKPYKFDHCIPSTSPVSYYYEFPKCSGFVTKKNKGNFKIKGTVSGISNKTTLKYWASSPSICSYSTSGTGLPFPNEQIAYENTPNKGEIILDSSGKFEIYIQYPSGYYINQGETYVSPHINFLICESSNPKIIKLQLPIDTPYRSLGFNLSNHSREFQPIPHKKQ